MKKRNILSLATIALTTVCAFGVATSIFSRQCSHSYALGEETSTNNHYIDSNLPLADSVNLFTTIENVTKTSSGESFTFTFSANTILFPIAQTGLQKYPETTGVYVTPVDETYPKDKSLSDLTRYDVDINNIDEKTKYVIRDENNNIVYDDDGRPKLEEGHGFTYERPTYKAFVSMIDTANFKKRNINTVVIPYSISYGSWYTLLVSGISEDVIQNDSAKAGEEYSTLKTLIIGNNIETITDNAFINAPNDFVIKTVFDTKPAEWSDIFTDSKNVEYGYVPSEHELEIFDQSEKRNDKGEIEYYDDRGAIIDSEGYYLDSEGKRIVIIDESGEEVYLHYEGTPLTTYSAYRFQAGNYKNLASEKSFIIGYITETEKYPLLLSYVVDLPNGKTESRIFECPLEQPELFEYDAVGSLAGLYAITKIADIRLNPGESIDFNSIVFYNIFEAKVDETKEVYSLAPNFDMAYQAVPSLAISRKNNINDFFDIKFDSIKTVFGYTSISLKFDCVENAYKLVNEKKYKEKESGINDGSIKVRYSLRGFKASSYNVTTKDGKFKNFSFDESVSGGIPGDLDYYVMTKQKDNIITFLLQDSCVGNGFSANNAKKVEICGFNVLLDLCPTKKGTTQIISQSAVSFRFGALDILPDENVSISIFDANLFITLFFVIFVALYLLGTTGYYVFAKNIYKNDEFRRMNTKAYIKKVSIGFIGALFIVGAIAFIVLRFAMVSPTIAVFNPMDPLVIAFGVGGLISIGFFIKALVVAIKQEKTRRKNIKLRLGEEAADDGTN